MKNGSIGFDEWQFDSDIASVFVEHARQHIPNYESVINKCVRYCELNLDRQASIIDVGCATGHTLSRLYESGFRNLHGVDNSIHMIKLAPKDIATYVTSDELPKGHYDMILCNWTLHFIKNKKKYLRSIINNLNEGGAVIISEKTSKDPQMIQMYHDHKKSLGVSETEIQRKQKQLENVMFVKSTDWYINFLESIGFEVRVIDADWCFTTFLCRKEKWINATYLTGS
jgi:tRNA (cmo5U34)-methyltransferase